MKKNQKGSALLWTLVVIGVLSILIAASLTISFSYKKRAVVNHDKRQAYVTAKGFVEDIVDNILTSNDAYLVLFTDTTKDEYTPLVDEGQSIPLNITLPKHYEMGSINDASIRINEVTEEEAMMKSLGSITISVEAMYANQAFRVNADLWLGYTEKDGLKWQLIKYYQRDEGLQYQNNITNASELLSEFVYIYNLYVQNGNNNGAMKAIIEYMKKDPGWKNIPNIPSVVTNDKGETITTPGLQDQLLGMTYFDDLRIRKFLSFRNENNKFKEFNKEEIKKNILTVPVATMENGAIRIVTKEVDLSKNNFYRKNYYIQPKYSNSNRAFSFIFANESETPSNGGKINLFYNEGSWYYVEEVSLDGISNPSLLGPTSFDANSSPQLWENFKRIYLTEGNKIQ